MIMKLKIVAALLIVGANVCAYEEENFMQPHWDARITKKNNNKNEFKDEYKVIHTPRQLELEIAKKLEERALIQEPTIEIKKTEAKEEDNEQQKEMVQEAVVVEMSQPSWWRQHQTELIVGGVVGGLLIFGYLKSGKGSSID